MKHPSEQQFENEVIKYLTMIGGVKQWEYADKIKGTEDLWLNFKGILEQNNQGKISRGLTETEFNQVKKVIGNLRTPYQAGQFLYGINGISEVEVLLDSGKRVFLVVFDQSNVGAGNTVYQVVNQISRPRVVDGKQNRRFDVTLLINGLPIIHIELKKALHSSEESLNQMQQYIDERQFGDIFSTLQVLVAMTPHEIKYMANTTVQQFNKDFAFNWQESKNAEPVRSWKRFCDLVLSIPMAHDLATRYMILDGTKNKENIKVMRPYQVYATKIVLDKIAKYRFKYSEGKLGYIWHTTGSGKTITSFKTAWLASKLPHVHKVIFLVDRIALTNQTTDAYKAYDPVTNSNGSGVVAETATVSELHKRLKSKTDKNIIVTSIQKMSLLVGRKSFKDLEQNFIFIVDEAHRSTGDNATNDGMLQKIRDKIPHAGWVGYTGTPKFPETEEIFGELLHPYTIKEAIADRNVLGFKVEFKETIDAPDDPTQEDIDDNIKASVYDTSPDHVKIVVEDILNNWGSRSSDYKYNAMFTVHVGGQKTSSPRVMEYYKEFLEQNKLLPKAKQLRISASFSMVTSNTDYQLETNKNLLKIIEDYNTMFDTNYDMTSVPEFTNDLSSRLNKTATDRKFLDLVIVIDQMLTGFDAPELNTLYIDRTLKDSGLIQAYSRTNRVHNFNDKPYGNIVNYRWPVQNEEAMNKAFQVYSNRDSANVQMSLEEIIDDNIGDGILAGSYESVRDELKELLQGVRISTGGFKKIPDSENSQMELIQSLKEYNGLMNRLKQYPFDMKTGEGFPVHEIELFYTSIGITIDEEATLTSVIARDLRRSVAEIKMVDISQITLAMEHIREVIINYDYLIDLIAQLADEINESNDENAEKIKIEIDKELSKLPSEKERSRFGKFIDRILKREFIFGKYPAPRNVEAINIAIDESEDRVNNNLIAKFIYEYGLGNSTTPSELKKLINKHRKGENDLNKRNEITDLMNKSKSHYQELAVEEIADLSWIEYRNQIRNAVYELAEIIKENE